MIFSSAGSLHLFISEKLVRPGKHAENIHGGGIIHTCKMAPCLKGPARRARAGSKFGPKRCHLAMTNSLPRKDPPFLSSVNHLFRLGPSKSHGYVQ